MSDVERVRAAFEEFGSVESVRLDAVEMDGDRITKEFYIELWIPADADDEKTLEALRAAIPQGQIWKA